MDLRLCVLQALRQLLSVNGSVTVCITGLETATVCEWICDCLYYRQLEAQRRKERTEAHLYMNVQVLLEDAFFGYQGNDLFDPDRVQSRCVKIMHCTMLSVLYVSK